MTDKPIPIERGRVGTHEHLHANPDDYWPCACIKRARGRTQIKLHHKTAARCRTCGVTRHQSEAAGA